MNPGRVKVHGLEAKGDFRLPNGLGVQAAASYGKGSVRSTQPTGSGALDSIEPVKVLAGVFYRPDDGPFNAQIVATHSAGKKLSHTNNSCNAPATPPSAFNPTGSPATRCFTPSGFWIVDATASYEVVTGATVRAGLFNIFDKKYFWWSDVRGLTSTSAVVDAYSQPGRNFGLSFAPTL